MTDDCPAPAAPEVTILMANYNGARHIEAAVRSALRQTFIRLEVLIVDDASSDDSLAIVERLARADRRVRYVARTTNGGPAAARNQGLEMAAGRWVAIVDSDDLMHPQRIERMVGLANRWGCEVIADDLLIFHEDGAGPARRFLK